MAKKYLILKFAKKSLLNNDYDTPSKKFGYACYTDLIIGSNQQRYDIDKERAKICAKRLAKDYPEFYYKVVKFTV